MTHQRLPWFRHRTATSNLNGIAPESIWKSKCALGKYLTFFENSKTGETWEREVAWDLNPLTFCISELSRP